MAVWAGVNDVALAGLTLYVLRTWDWGREPIKRPLLFFALLLTVVVLFGGRASYNLWRLKSGARSRAAIFFVILVGIALTMGLSLVNMAHAAVSIVILGVLLTPAAAEECS